MSTPAALLDMIRRFEGLRLRSYLCPAGIWTVGYGATGADVGAGVVWTEEQATARLERDAAAFWRRARALCPKLGETQLIAVADFAYNLGAARLAGSTLRRRANMGDIAGAAQEFPKWVHGGGRVLPGLVLRRAVEQHLFLASV